MLMSNQIYIIEKLDVDTGILWWNGNRQKLNEVIDMFNKWQTEYQFDEFEAEVVLAKINITRKYGFVNDFADWQYELLAEMEEHIVKIKS